MSRFWRPKSKPIWPQKLPTGDLLGATILVEGGTALIKLTGSRAEFTLNLACCNQWAAVLTEAAQEMRPR